MSERAHNLDMISVIVAVVVTVAVTVAIIWWVKKTRGGRRAP